MKQWSSGETKQKANMLKEYIPVKYNLVFPILLSNFLWGDDNDK